MVSFRGQMKLESWATSGLVSFRGLIQNFWRSRASRARTPRTSSSLADFRFALYVQNIVLPIQHFEQPLVSEILLFLWREKNEKTLMMCMLILLYFVHHFNLVLLVVDVVAFFKLMTCCCIVLYFSGGVGRAYKLAFLGVCVEVVVVVWQSRAGISQAWYQINVTSLVG